MSKFYPWTPDGSNLEKSAAFENETQRLEGFKSGNIASSAILNTALCQSNLIAVALVEALQKIYTNNDINATTKQLLENADIDSYKSTTNQLATLFATSLTNAFAKAKSVYYHKIHFRKVISDSTQYSTGISLLEFDIYLFDTSADRASMITNDTLHDRLTTNDYTSCLISNVIYTFRNSTQEGVKTYAILSAKFDDTLNLSLQYLRGFDIVDVQFFNWYDAEMNYTITVTDNIISLTDILS